MLDENYCENIQWHLDSSKKINKNRIEELCNKNIKVINKFKNGSYEELIVALKSGCLQRNDLGNFLSKIDYYLLKIYYEKQEMGFHVVVVNDKVAYDEEFRSAITKLYCIFSNNGSSKISYILLNTKYKDIAKGCAVDLREVQGIKQIKYLKNYAEICFYKKRLKEIYCEQRDRLFLKEWQFNCKNSIEQMENISEALHEIYDIKDIYVNTICKLLRKNTSYMVLNPYEVSSYYEIINIIHAI